MKIIKYIFIVPLLSLLVSLNTANAASEPSIGASGLPLPRFVSLQADKVNMRTGPGTRYPIEWVYKKEFMPIEIIAEYDIWRRVRDYEGSIGWVHKSTLSGRRTVITTNNESKLYASDDVNAQIVATLDSGVVGRILSCQQAWCEVAFDMYEGYMMKSDFWGTYSNETIDD